MKLARFGILITLLTLTAASFAGTLKSSNVSIPGGTINPRESLELASDSLVPYSVYNVMCDIADPTNKTDPTTIQLKAYFENGSGSNSSVSLNGNQYSFGSGHSLQLKLPQTANTFAISNISPYGDGSILTIYNLDQKHAITVSNCRAVAATAN